MKNETSNKETKFSLHNSENYKTELTSNICDVTKIYSELIMEYFRFIQENIKLSASKMSKFIITRGLDTITNVFLNLLYYTKNLDVTYFHCQKSFYFYVEFVGQISDDEKMFLQLTSRDATTYVYKKTIFEINNEFKKLHPEISSLFISKLDIIKIYINIYQTYLFKIINSTHKKEINKEIQLSYIDQFIKITEKLNTLNNDLLHNKSNVCLLEKIIDKLYDKIEDADFFFKVNFMLAKKFLKNNNIVKNVEEKIHLDEFNDKLLESNDKFISWFLI
jgi:hypothetical protein